MGCLTIPSRCANMSSIRSQMRLLWLIFLSKALGNKRRGTENEDEKKEDREQIRCWVDTAGRATMVKRIMLKQESRKIPDVELDGLSCPTSPNYRATSLLCNFGRPSFLALSSLLHLLLEWLLLVFTFWLFIISCRLLVLLIFSDQILHAVGGGKSTSGSAGTLSKRPDMLLCDMCNRLTCSQLQ